MGGVHTFLISGYRFRNELIGAKGTCAKINTSFSMIGCIKSDCSTKWSQPLVKPPGKFRNAKSKELYTEIYADKHKTLP